MVSFLRRAVGSPVVRYGFLALAVALAVWAVWRDRDQVADAVGRLGALAVLLAAVVTVLHVAAAGAGWRAVVADLGSPLRPRDAATMFLVGQVARYVPGGVWQVVALTEAGVRHDIPRRRTASASLVAIGVSVAVGAALTLALLGPAGALRVPAWTALAAPLPLLALHPRVLNPLLNRLVRLARRAPLEHPLTGGGVARAAVWAALAWLMLGSQIYVLAVGLGAPAGLRTAAISVGGFIVAWVVGLLVVVAPAGVGVREVVLAGVLSGLLDTGAVVLLVLVSRVLLTVVELACAAMVLALDLRRRPG